MAAKAVEKDSWILDSGAADYVTNEKENLKEFVALPSTAWLADGVTQMKSEGHASMFVKSMDRLTT